MGFGVAANPADHPAGGRVRAESRFFERQPPRVRDSLRRADPILFYIDIAQPDTVHDVRELDPVFTPDYQYNPGVRFSVAPDGKTAIVGTWRRQTTVQLLENFQRPSLLRQLGLFGR